jgi:hypothetical protein
MIKFFQFQFWTLLLILFLAKISCMLLIALAKVPTLLIALGYLAFMDLIHSE